MIRQASLAELTGVGRILLNGQVAADGVQYHVSLSRTMHAARGGEISGDGHIGGRLLSSFPMMLIGEDIELELQDGPPLGLSRSIEPRQPQERRRDFLLQQRFVWIAATVES